MLLSKLYLKEPTFSTLLTMCRSDYKFIDFATFKSYNCLFISKVLIVCMLTWVVKWLKRQREVDESCDDRIQRAKNYLLEDYLEENKLSMADLAKIEENARLRECMKLLKSCKYDYERYKIERKRFFGTNKKSQIERDAFLNEVKRFKNEIESTETGGKFDDNVEINEAQAENENENKKINTNINEHHKENEEEEKNESFTKNRDIGSDEDVCDWRQLFAIERPEYFYNLMQTAALLFLTILIIKVKYVLTPFLCIIASTFPPKAMIPRNFSLWLIYAIVVGSCIIDRGIHNIKEQYNLKESVESPSVLEQNSLHDMLKWIKSNTDRTEVFAGPNDIIGLVLLATGRPIVNNALNNHPHMK